MGCEFSRSHLRLHTPSDTFANFHRWIHMSNQEYLVFHLMWYLSLLALPNTCIFHFLFLLCNHETHFGRCPISLSPPLNTKHIVNLPRTHDIPSNTKHSVVLYHVLMINHRTPNTESISTMHSHPCHEMSHA